MVSLPSLPPRGTQTTAVYLDEEDGLVAMIPPTPTDPGFRRGLFVMLVVLGMLSAGALIQSQRNEGELRTARLGQQAAERRAEDLARDLDRLLTNQENLEQRNKESQDRNEQFQRLLVSILARSNDPVLREAFADLAREQGFDPDDPFGTPTPTPAPTPTLTPTSGGGAGTTRPSPRSSPRPRRTERPRSSPSPRPSPSPSPTRPPPIVTLPEPLPTLVPDMCVVTELGPICTP